MKNFVKWTGLAFAVLTIEVMLAFAILEVCSLHVEQSWISLIVVAAWSLGFGFCFRKIDFSLLRK